MDELEKQEKAKELREKLRNGRISTASPATEGNSRDDGEPERTTFQIARGEVSNVTPDSRKVTDDDRLAGGDGGSPKKRIIRNRRTDRRSGKDNRRTSASTKTTESELKLSEPAIGNLIADGPIPKRKLDEPVALIDGIETSRRRGGRPKKEKPFEIPRPALLKQLKTLSEKEANELTDPFIASMTDNFQYLDTYLWGRQVRAGKTTNEKPVWSDLDEEEVQALTRVMMRFGQHNTAAASAVRGVVESRDYISVGAILVPRVQETVKIMRDTTVPRAPRQKPIKQGRKSEGE